MNLKQIFNWKTLGLMASTLAFGARLYADQGPATGTPEPNFPIVNSDGSGLPMVNLLATDPTALEGTSSGSFTLLLYGASTVDLNVNLIISGTASNGVDYSTISNVVTIPAGSLAVDIPVTPLIDTANRGNKTVQLAIQTNSTYRVGGYRKATVQIIDDSYNVPPPSITLTNPVDGTSFTNPPSITLQAEINDTDIPVQGVSFYVNDFFLGRTTTSPYSLVWSNPPAGQFALFARMTDELGRSALSVPVHVTVARKTVEVVAPQVTITSPTNLQVFKLTSAIPIQAQVTDADSSAVIQQVSFYANTQLLGVASNAPYAFNWTNAPGGVTILRAVATDQNGVRGYSGPVVVIVTTGTGDLPPTGAQP